MQLFGRQGISAGTYALLALFVSPADFGLMTLAGVFVNLAVVLGDLGFGAAIVQRKEMADQELSTIFAVNMALASVLAAVGIMGSGLAAELLHEPRLAAIIVCLCSTLPLTAVSAVQFNILTRQMRFRELAIRDIVAGLLGGGVALILAANGQGVWSLVIQVLTSSVVGAVLVWRASAWRPKMSLVCLGSLRDISPFSLKMFVFSLLKFTVQNVDKYLVGRWLGVPALGIYVFAQRVVIAPVNGVVGAIGNYLFPRFARKQEDVVALRGDYRIIIALTLGGILPALLAAGILARTLIERIFGPEWASAATLVQILALAAFGQAIASPIGQMMKALGKAGWLVSWTIVINALTTAGVTVGVIYGTLEAVAIGWTVTYLIGTLVSVVILSVLLGIRWSAFGRDFFPLIATIGCSVIYYCIQYARNGLPDDILSSAVLVSILTIAVVLAGWCCVPVREAWRRRAWHGLLLSSSSS